MGLSQGACDPALLRFAQQLVLPSSCHLLVCATVTARRLNELGIPEDLEIIEEDRILDQGGIEMLGKMLRRLL